MPTTPQPFRGLHYDLARGNYDSLDSLRRLITVCAECGLNELVFYMEDLWRYKKHPQLVNAHAYSLEDMAGLAKFACGVGVDFIPSLTTIGHSFHILEKPEYQHLAFPGSHADFDVLNPAVYDLFADLFDEVLPHFSSPFVHINGDEVRYTALNEKAQEFVRQHGMGALFGTGLGRLARMVLKRGRRPIVWHDMLLHHPDSLDFLPKETIICYWFYDYQQEFPALDFFRAQGFDVLAAPGLITNRSKTPDLARAMPNVYEQCRAATRSLQTKPEPNGDRVGTCLGTLTTIWEDVNWYEGILPIYATGRWTNDAEVPYAPVLAEFAHDIYGIDNPALGSTWTEASRLGGATCLLEEGRPQAHSAEEYALFNSEITQHHAALQPLTAEMMAGQPQKNADVFQSMVATAAKLTVCGTPPAEQAFTPAASPIPALFCLDHITPGDATCRLIEAQTPYGHRLVVLTNGQVAVSLLPDFAATMVEWVLLGEQPKAFIDAAGYRRWAAETPRDPQDPGLLSPWGVTRVGGWRETIYYNARLNPSSLWGYPFTVNVVTNTPEEIAVEFSGLGNVAEVRRVVRLRAGERTIGIETTVTNRIAPGYLGIQPNVGYQLPGSCAPDCRLVNGDCSRLLADHDGTMLFTPQSDTVCVQSQVNDRSLQLRFQPEEMLQILTDVGAAWFTLEPFSRPQFCRTGESVTLHLEYELG
ncbi:MAG: family 20 glycosylhydrolase [Armatimonadota bacterium]